MKLFMTVTALVLFSFSASATSMYNGLFLSKWVGENNCSLYPWGVVTYVNGVQNEIAYADPKDAQLMTEQTTVIDWITTARTQKVSKALHIMATNPEVKVIANDEAVSKDAVVLYHDASALNYIDSDEARSLSDLVDRNCPDLK